MTDAHIFWPSTRAPPAPAPFCSTATCGSSLPPSRSFPSSIRSPAGSSTTRKPLAVAARGPVRGAGTRRRAPAQVAALAIANQRETVVVWNRHTGQPIHNAIVWQCRRTAEACEALKARGLEDMIRRKTGLVLDAYLSATKIQWILDHVEGARDAARRGDLLCGTIDSWLLWKLSGGAVHATDFTNASRTLLFDIHRLCWDDELLALFDIPAAMLPAVVPSSGPAAECRLPEFGDHHPPVLGIAGDQQAALFGQGCFAPGQAKNTYGTGCFLLMNTGGEPVFSRQGLLTTLTAQTRPGAPNYALEGSVFIAGAVLQWLRDELQILASAADSDAIAAAIPDTGGVYLVPAFAGLGAPHWDMYARGALVGLTRGTGRPQIIRAALEAIAYQCVDVVDAMLADDPHPIAVLRADGGASANDFLMQFQADVLGCPVERPDCTESTALGAAPSPPSPSAGTPRKPSPCAPRNTPSRPPCPATNASACWPAGARPCSAPPAGPPRLREPHDKVDEATLAPGQGNRLSRIPPRTTRRSSLHNACSRALEGRALSRPV
jgi:glycerol kinase